MTTAQVRPVRVILPGDEGERPDLYDAETQEYVATAASPEAARSLVRAVWDRTTRTTLKRGETGVDPAICKRVEDYLAQTDARPVPHEPWADDAMIVEQNPLAKARAFLNAPIGEKDDREKLLETIDHLSAVVRWLDSPASAPELPSVSAPRGGIDYGADRPETTAAMPPREPNARELAEQLVWDTRRLLDAQWDVAQTLARVAAAADRT